MTQLVSYAEYEFPIADKDNDWNPHIWITIERLSLCIKQTDEGVVVDIYPLDHEDEEPITSTYAFFAEGIVEKE